MQNIWGKEMRAMKDDRFLKFTLSLSRMNKKVQAVKTAGMGMVGLKAAHTAVLYALSGHSEGLQFAEVAAACDLDPALISRTFSELIAAAMVEKQGEPGRYRARYVLTEQGSLQTAKIRQVIGLVQENADKNIAPEDLQTFYRVLEQLLNNFEEMSEHYDTVFESLRRESHCHALTEWRGKMDAMQKFLEYASAYDDGSDTRIKLKIIHTQRVTEVMEQLTAVLPLSESDRELAYLCAVYHDIGRFEQLKRYHTFLDYKSIDHAQLGCEILRQGNFLDELSAREREQVLTAIGNHNRLAIEDGLDEKTLLFAKLIRDADKCDIFRVFAQEDPVDTTGFSAEQVEQEAVSDVVYESILGHYCIKKQERKTGLDVWVSFLGFFFDLNFAESLRIALKQGYYKKRFLDLNFEDPATEERVRRCIAETEQYAYARLRMEELQ